MFWNILEQLGDSGGSFNKDVGDWKVRRVIVIAAYISNRTFSDNLMDEQQEELLAAQQEL